MGWCGTLGGGFDLRCFRSRVVPIKRLHPSTLFHTSYRIQFTLSRQFSVSRARSDDSSGFGSRNFAYVPSTLLASEKEEAKAILSLFLTKQGLTNALASRTINKSDKFIDHLISKLHSLHKTRYLVGRELTTLEIREALIPCLESLLEEHGDVLVEVVENFPNPPGKSKVVSTIAKSEAQIGLRRKKAVARVSEQDSEGLLPPHILYLMEIGLDIHQIREITRKFPAFAYYSLDRKIKPVVEFLLDLGVPKKDIPTILCKRPQLCGISLSGNLIPTMTYLEGMGVDKTQWAKVIYRFPALLTYSRQKVKTSIDYLAELGVSPKNIGKILTRCPHIISYSVDDKLRPTAEYFHSLGMDVASLMHRCPQTFGLSIDGNLKPITEFFLEKGYSIEEIKTMVSRYGALYTFSLADNLIPKWNFFLTMGYPRSELVKFPQFFGYSLEERIKPRFGRVSERGIKVILNQLLSLTDAEFEKMLEKRMDQNV